MKHLKSPPISTDVMSGRRVSNVSYLLFLLADALTVALRHRFAHIHDIILDISSDIQKTLMFDDFRQGISIKVPSILIPIIKARI